MLERITIDAATIADAMQLAARLEGLRTEIVKQDTGYAVEVGSDRDTDEALVRVLDAAEAWLAGASVGSLRIRLNGHAYVVHRPAGAPRP